MVQSLAPRRRRFLLGAATALASGCRPHDELAHIAGGFGGIHPERGHLLRSQAAMPTPQRMRRTRVVIAGGGVAGLAAARALRLRGQDDFAMLELEDQAGGNARTGSLNGLACPLGAHYLPLPSDDAHEVQDLLEELGLRRRVAGRWTYDETHLCHSPQERLFIHGGWQEGLLPLQGVGPSTHAQYRRFSAQVREAQRQGGTWRLPAWRGAGSALKTDLARQTFASWLQAQGLDDPYLLWFLDYCCRDDFGAGCATVSAWAGLHYFASRHGFSHPDEASAEREEVLTWPEGNGWLTSRLAAPLDARLHTGRVVLRIELGRHGVTVDAWDAASQTSERWQADRVIVALPVFVAARVVRPVPGFLRVAAERIVYAPWLVANLHLKQPLRDVPGAAPSWDNVLYQSPGLGYVDAGHQRVQRAPGATVLTWYHALGNDPGGLAAARQRLLESPWQYWRAALVQELSQPHPDLARKITRIDITRYGHAMAVPVPAPGGPFPGLTGFLPYLAHGRSRSKPQPSRPSDPRLLFAHSDWMGYSVFEEAFTLGHLAGSVA